MLGAAVSAGVMVLGVGALRRRARLSYDTSIGLFFVGMLALGVIIVSGSRSFATDVTAILFGDVLAVTRTDLAGLATAVLVALGIAAAFHRPFTALAFDARKAATLGLRPRLAEVVLVALVTLAVVASYRAVGTLLVVGLLLARQPPPGRGPGASPARCCSARRSAPLRCSRDCSSPGTPAPPPARASPSSRSPPSYCPEPLPPSSAASR